MTAANEAIFLRPANGTACAVHDWPTERFAERLVDEMRAKHGKGGVDVCVDCLARAKASIGRWMSKARTSGGSRIAHFVRPDGAADCHAGREYPHAKRDWVELRPHDHLCGICRHKWRGVCACGLCTPGRAST